MTPNDHRKVLTVFIGSPSDVMKERTMLHAIVEELNNVVREIGWQIDLRGWEDVMPGIGRAQEKINQDVKECNLFIGLLHARWGTPTGKYSSGFEEEFTIACDLNKEKGQPEVWLFFKKVSAAQAATPNEELQKVLTFRQKLIDDKALFFTDVKNSKQWEKKMRENLHRHVLQLSKKTEKQAEDEQSPESTPAPSNLKLDEENEIEAAPRSLQNLLKEVAKKVTKPSELSDLQAARLHLFSTSAVPENYNLRLENHVANLLYVHRTSLRPTLAETKVLYATLIADVWDHIPGWYWFLDDKRHGVKRLIHSAMFSSNEEVRRRATDLLEKAPIQLEIKGIPHKTFMAIFLMDSSEELIPKKFECLAKLGGLKDIPILDQLLSSSTSPSIIASAQSARARIMARHEPNRVLTDVVENRVKFSPALGEELNRQKDKLETQILIAAAKHLEKEVRVFAGEQLDDRNEVGEELAMNFLNDESYTLKTLGQKKLLLTGGIKPNDIKSGRLGDDLHPEKISLLSREPIETLRAKVDWVSVSGWDAYEALARHHFNDFEQQIRYDLSNGFKELRTKSLKKFEEQYGAKSAEILKDFKEGEDMDIFIHDSLVAIALDAIAVHGKSSDVIFGRRYLNAERTETRIAAIKILSQFGDMSDCGPLLQLTKAESKSIRRPAARAALKLSDRSDSVIYALLASDDPLLVEIVLATLEAKDARKFMHTLKGLLQHKLDSIRVLTVACLHRLCSRKTLEKILDEYHENKFYFYNVICWLDRILYAPAPLREYFGRELQKPFGNHYD